MHRKSLSLTRNRCLKISANCVSSTDQWPVCDTGAPELGLASTVPSVESSVKVNHTFKHDLCCFLLVVLIRFVFIKYMVMKKPATAVSCRQNLCTLTWLPPQLPPALHSCSLTCFPFQMCSFRLTSLSRNSWPFWGKGESVPLVGSLQFCIWVNTLQLKTKTRKNPIHSSV